MVWCLSFCGLETWGKEVRDIGYISCIDIYIYLMLYICYIHAKFNVWHISIWFRVGISHPLTVKWWSVHFYLGIPRINLHYPLFTHSPKDGYTMTPLWRFAFVSEDKWNGSFGKWQANWWWAMPRWLLLPMQERRRWWKTTWVFRDVHVIMSVLCCGWVGKNTWVHQDHLDGDAGTTI